MKYNALEQLHSHLKKKTKFGKWYDEYTNIIQITIENILTASKNNQEITNAQLVELFILCRSEKGKTIEKINDLFENEIYALNYLYQIDCLNEDNLSFALNFNISFIANNEELFALIFKNSTLLESEQIRRLVSNGTIQKSHDLKPFLIIKQKWLEIMDTTYEHIISNNLYECLVCLAHHHILTEDNILKVDNSMLPVLSIDRSIFEFLNIDFICKNDFDYNKMRDQILIFRKLDLSRFDIIYLFNNHDASYADALFDLSNYLLNNFENFNHLPFSLKNFEQVFTHKDLIDTIVSFNYDPAENNIILSYYTDNLKMKLDRVKQAHSTAKIELDTLVDYLKNDSEILRNELDTLEKLGLLNHENFIQTIKNSIKLLLQYKSSHLPKPSEINLETSHAINADLIQNRNSNINKLIREYYLLPYKHNRIGPFLTSRKETKNPTDGFIERHIHGVMHASEVSALIILMHNFSMMYAEKKITSFKQSLESVFDIGFNDLLDLTVYVGAFHDSARQDDANDFWDEASARNCYDYFLNNGVSEMLAFILASFILIKDKSKKDFFDYYKRFELENSSLKALYYLKTLLFCADCIDIIRCVGKFKYEILFDTLKSLFNLSDYSDMKNYLISICHTMASIIQEQGNLLFDTKIADQHYKASFSLSKKTKYEFSPTPFDDQCLIIFSRSKFSPQVTARLTRTDSLEIQPAFNPFIHAVSSLPPMLKQLSFRIMSPLTMVYDYNLSPITGELIKGGYDRFISISKIIGNPSFGRLHPINSNHNTYTLEKIISNYAQTSYGGSHQDDIYTFQNIVADVRENNFSKQIHLVPIYLLRCLQDGKNLNKIFSENDRSVFMAELKTAIKLHQFIGRIYKDIFPNVLEFNQLTSKEKEKIKFKILKTFKRDKLIKILQEYPGEIFDTNKKLSTAFMEFISNKLVITTKLTNSFRVFADNEIATPSSKSEHTSITRVDQVENLFVSLFYYPGRDNFNKSQQHYKEVIKDYELLFNFLTKQFSEPKFTLFNEAQKLKIHRNMRIIYLSENEEKIQVSHFSTDEYRATQPLEIGSDINIMAVKKRKHQLMLMVYLAQNQLKHVATLLFDDLLYAKHFRTRPTFRYHNPDHTLKDSWRIAKKVCKSGSSVEDYCSQHPKRFFSTKPEEVSPFLEDAKTYYQFRTNQIM